MTRLPGSKAFTLIELLVSMTILSLLILVMTQVVNQTSRIWSSTISKAGEFRAAREGFEVMTRQISQATLATFWDYDNSNAPTQYIRQSYLRFISGPVNGGSVPLFGGETVPLTHPSHGIFFQAPLGTVNDQTNYHGMENLLNTWGFFIEYGSDSVFRPSFVNTMANPPPARYRYRLMELAEPSERLSLYNYTSGTGANGLPKNQTYTGHDWFTGPRTTGSPSQVFPLPLVFPLPIPPATDARPVHIVAENIVALVVLPQLAKAEDPSGLALAPSYTYDTTNLLPYTDPSTPTVTPPQGVNVSPKNQLPPVVQVTMVAIDETTASRIFAGAGPTTPPDFGVNNLFQSAVNDQADLITLQNKLTSLHINWRTFTVNVSLRGAKWSRY